MLELKACLATAVLQILFLYFRTLNTQHVSQGRITKAMITEAATSLCRLLSIALGVNSIINGGWAVALTYVAGAVLGTYLAMKNKKKI